VAVLGKSGVSGTLLHSTPDSGARGAETSSEERGGGGRNQRIIKLSVKKSGPLHSFSGIRSCHGWRHPTLLALLGLSAFPSLKFEGKDPALSNQQSTVGKCNALCRKPFVISSHFNQ